MNDLIPATILTEMSEIESQMGTQAYWKNAPLQARYRTLAEQKVQMTSAPSSETESEARVPIVSMAEYAAVNGTTAGYDRYVKVSMSAADVVIHLSANDSAATISSFERLPQEAAAAAVGELLSSRPAASWATEAQVAKFRTHAAGRILSEEWGQDTARNLGVVRARMWRALDRLDLASGKALNDWLDGLPDAAWCAVCRKLAA